MEFDLLVDHALDDFGGLELERAREQRQPGHGTFQPMLAAAPYCLRVVRQPIAKGRIGFAAEPHKAARWSRRPPRGAGAGQSVRQIN